MTIKNITLFTLLCFSLSAFGQTPFWTENFAEGLPSTWGNEDVSGNGAVWTWCANPENPNGPGCPLIWDDAINNQVPFASSTASNGFVTVNSDAAGNITHESELTTPSIDCSTYSEVWITFETHIGVFTFSAEENAVLKVSNDGGDNWEIFTVFPGLTTGERWSENPENISIDISSVAANESNVLIQWSWVGSFEYNWNLDDIALYDMDPRPAVDLQVDPFFAVAPNALTPVTQIEPIGFIADITNKGREDQESSTLRVTVTNSQGTEVFTDEMTYGMIQSDSTDQNRFFENQFTPPAEVEVYTVTYEIITTEADGNPDNNTQSYTFAISNGTFAKHQTITNAISPADDDSYTYGNVFYVTEDATAQSLTFGASAEQGESLEGRTVTTYLYKWEGDVNEDFFANVVEMEGEAPVAFNSYIFTADDDGVEVTLPIDLDAGTYPLEAGSYYIVAVQYNGDDGTSFTLASEEYDYAAMNFYTDSLEMPRFAGALDIGNTGEFNLFNFGLDIVPAISLDLVTGTSSVETVLPAGSFKVFPNPTSELATVQINLDQAATTMDLKLVDINGKVLMSDKLTDVQKQDYNINVSELPNGNYFLRARTEQGIATVKIVVIH